MIKPNGKIIVKKDLQKRIKKYAKLNNTDVPWIEYIGKRGWPTSEQLSLAYNYKKRSRKDYIEDILLESEESDEDEKLSKNKSKRRKK